MKRPHLFERHKELGAKFVEFGGWEMPLEYSGAVKEHMAVRNSAGLFDVSHMGVIEVGGADSIQLLKRALTFSPDSLKPDRARYAFLLNDKGGAKDDLMTFRLNEERFILVVNASNREKDLNWLKDIGRDFKTVLIDDSPDTCILALQGPASWQIAEDAFGVKPAEFPYHSFVTFEFSGTGVMLSKTGYTGEKGFEIYVHRTVAGDIWDLVLEKGETYGILPCGLAARDTLRLEMGYLLYGNDINEDISPIEAGYLNFIDFGNEKFIGRDALLEIKGQGPDKKLMGLVLTEPGVPRHGYPVTSGGREVGYVTSGNFSPSLHKGIAMSYIHAGITDAAIVIRGKAHAAEAVELPFYRKKMRYIPNTPDDRKKMLDAVGASDFKDLIREIPDGLLLKEPLKLPPALSEMELLGELSAIAALDADSSKYAYFLGGGAYDHFIPSAVRAVASRSEFATAYTPYQAEVSQGTLQATFEYQSMVCELTGMGAANASMYDGASAMAEGALMAERVTGRSEVAVSRAVHPHYRHALKTYMRGLGSPVVEIPYDSVTGTTDMQALSEDIGPETAAVIVQYPNFFGCIEDLRAVAAAAHEKGALLVAVVDPIALGILKSPGELGADIVVAEGQGLGKSMSFGGPYLGIFACKEDFIRQMPGRIVGETKDRRGNRGYVLTLQAREQHIKRERATSNICTNEALVALMAAVYLSVMGPAGLRAVAELCLQKSHYAADELAKKGIRPAFTAPFFKEFVVASKDLNSLNKRILKDNIIGGLDLGGYYPELPGRVLVAVTEKRTRKEIDKFAGHSGTYMK